MPFYNAHCLYHFLVLARLGSLICYILKCKNALILGATRCDLLLLVLSSEDRWSTPVEGARALLKHIFAVPLMPWIGTFINYSEVKQSPRTHRHTQAQVVCHKPDLGPPRSKYTCPPCLGRPSTALDLGHRRPRLILYVFTHAHSSSAGLPPCLIRRLLSSLEGCCEAVVLSLLVLFLAHATTTILISHSPPAPSLSVRPRATREGINKWVQWLVD